jgi:hypothetical protein
MPQIRKESQRVSLRVDKCLYEWIEQQAIDSESPGQTVKRLLGEMAKSNGATLLGQHSSIEERLASILSRIQVVERQLQEGKCLDSPSVSVLPIKTVENC